MHDRRYLGIPWPDDVKVTKCPPRTARGAMRNMIRAKGKQDNSAWHRNQRTEANHERELRRQAEEAANPSCRYGSGQMREIR